MDRYILRVVDGDADADRSKTETVMADVDRLFGEICRNIVRAELRLQGEVPDSLLPRSGPFGEGALCSDARRFMDETLDYLGGPSSGTWMDDTFPDVPGRRRIARIVLDISPGLYQRRFVRLRQRQTATTSTILPRQVFVRSVSVQPGYHI